MSDIDTLQTLGIILLAVSNLLTGLAVYRGQGT